MESAEDLEKEKESNPHVHETAGTLITMGFVPASDKFRADTFRAAGNTSIKDAYNTLFYQNNSVMPPGEVKHFTIKSAIIGTITFDMDVASRKKFSDYEDASAFPSRFFSVVGKNEDSFAITI